MFKTLNYNLIKSEVSNIKSILLIDDDEDDCFFLRKSITQISDTIEVNCVNNLDSIFDAIKNVNPSLIIIDFHLPKINGIECLKKLKSHPQYKNVPLVVWSSYLYTEQINSVYKEGAEYYFNKPSDFNDWVEVAKRIYQLI